MILTVAATKGGAGKTTTAVCLALEAVAQGVDTSIIDLDPQGTAYKWAPEITKHLPDLRSAREFRQVAGDQALVIVDTPPNAAPQAIAAIEAADVTITPTALDPGDMDALLDLLRVVDPDLIVPTRRDARRLMHRYALEALAARWPDRVTTPIPESSVIGRAQAEHEGLPIVSPPAVAYRSVLARTLELA